MLIIFIIQFNGVMDHSMDHARAMVTHVNIICYVSLHYIISIDAQMHVGQTWLNITYWGEHILITGNPMQ